jgi:hypothetical protein
MKTKQVFNLIKMISWIIFISLCIKAGAILISFLVSLSVNPEASQNLYLGTNLSALFDFSERYYIYIVSFKITIVAFKAYLFYLVIKVLQKLKFNDLFNRDIASLISKISYYALVTGGIAVIANSYSKWLLKKGATFELDWGGTEFLFMAGILFIIGYIFKRGIEIQEENDLTI